MKTNLTLKKLALLVSAGALLYTGPSAFADPQKSDRSDRSDRSSNTIGNSDTEMSFEYGHDGLEIREPAGAAVATHSYSTSVSDADTDAMADRILRMYQRGKQHAEWLDRQLKEGGV